MNDALVRLWKRPSRDGKRFSYVLIYRDENGKKRFESLAHADARKAEKQRIQRERELRMGIVEPGSMRLSEFLADSLERTRGQVRGSTLKQAKNAMNDFIKVFGDMDYLRVDHHHGERFIQACLDNGNCSGTVGKKVRHLKRLFQLATDRGQLEENPLKRISPPKSPARKVRVYSDDECQRLISAAGNYQRETGLQWELLTLVALTTAMRKGELLNTTWRDIDFARQVIDIEPKKSTDRTWEWHIKDTDRRSLPLTEEIVQLLVKHQEKQPEGYPYVFVPPQRYDRIQLRRSQDNWSVEDGCSPVNNFSRQFDDILLRAGIEIEHGEFHDFRRTCLTNWLASGMSEYEVMKLAGHASFDTTRRFYLAVRGDILDRARQASSAALQGNLVARWLRAPISGKNENGCQT